MSYGDKSFAMHLNDVKQFQAYFIWYAPLSCIYKMLIIDVYNANKGVRFEEKFQLIKREILNY